MAYNIVKTFNADSTLWWWWKNGSKLELLTGTYGDISGIATGTVKGPYLTEADALENIRDAYSYSYPP